MAYVDGFVIPVPKKKVAPYRKLALWGRKLWMKHGALQYFECVGDDLQPKFGLPFPKLLKLKPGETAMFSFIIFKSRAHRDKVNALVMKDPSMQGPPPEMPFDMRKMAYGGFQAIVEA
jgi:uncharacterized protein YbaA (DUF1428 family)